MKLDRTNLKKVQASIYDLWQARFNKMYKDTDWHNVFDFATNIKKLYGIEFVDLKAGKYFYYLQNANDNIPPYRKYDIRIKTFFGYLAGDITCCSAGMIENPFEMYDMLINLSIDTDQEDDKD